jgi:Prolipoprotein diacylglyceryl transferase
MVVSVPAVRVGSWPIFRVCAAAGVVAGIAVGVGMMVLADRPAWPIAVAAPATLLAFATLAVAADGRLISLRHQVAALGAVAVASALARAPVLATLDASALGLGVALAVGRVGCLLAPCCYGRPGPRGVRYGPEHAELPARLVGVPLVPVQAIEAAGLLAVVALGAALIAGGAVAGVAFAVYAVGYSVLRFGTERLRGDADRGAYAGVWEAQWTAFAIVAAVTLGGLVGVLPVGAWPAAALLALGLAAVRQRTRSTLTRTT